LEESVDLIAENAPIVSTPGSQSDYEGDGMIHGTFIDPQGGLRRFLPR
jgi:hypothetical protein